MKCCISEHTVQHFLYFRFQNFKEFNEILHLRAYSTAFFEYLILKTQGILLNTASLSIQYNCFSIFFWFIDFGLACLVSFVFIVLSQKWLKIFCFSMCFSPFNCESAVLYAQEFKKHVFFYVFVPRVYQKRCTVCIWFQKTLVLQCVSIVFLLFFLLLELQKWCTVCARIKKSLFFLCVRAIHIAKVLYCMHTNSKLLGFSMCWCNSYCKSAVLYAH